MVKIGRNTPCPCGSGNKYKRCCLKKEPDMMQHELPSGKFDYQSGSYGGPGRGYMPSIIGYNEVSTNSWKEHLCLVKPAIVLDDEDSAAAISEKDLAKAIEILADGGGPKDFALSLRREGYKSVSDFHVVNES